jgi:hypothetical protein
MKHIIPACAVISPSRTILCGDLLAGDQVKQVGFPITF